MLYGAAVVTVGGIIGFQQGVIGMCGEGEKWTSFSQAYNLVIDITPVKGLDPHTHKATVRFAGLKAAEFVGEAGRSVEPDEVLTYEMEDVANETAKYPALPKALYVEMLISQGLLHDGYIWGK